MGFVENYGLRLYGNKLNCIIAVSIVHNLTKLNEFSPKNRWRNETRKYNFVMVILSVYTWIVCDKLSKSTDNHRYVNKSKWNFRPVFEKIMIEYRFLIFEIILHLLTRQFLRHSDTLDYIIFISLQHGFFVKLIKAH